MKNSRKLANLNKKKNKEACPNLGHSILNELFIDFIKGDNYDKKNHPAIPVRSEVIDGSETTGNL